MDRFNSTVAVFLLWSALLLIATASGHIHSPDGEINYRTTRSLANGEGYSVSPLPDGFLTRQGKDGKEYPQYGPLQPLIATPFYWIGERVAPLVPESWLSHQEKRLETTVLFYRGDADAFGDDFEGFYPDDHKERVCRIAISFFNPFVTWTTVLWLLFWGKWAIRKGRAALLLPFTYLLATYAWPHSRPFYTEPLATFFLLASLVLASGLSSTPGGSRVLGKSALVGLAAGLSVLTRLDCFVALPGILWIALAELSSTRKAIGRSQLAGALALGLLSFFLLAAVVPIQNWMRYGSVLATGYADQKEGIRFSIPFLHAMWIYLLSPGKGIFWYSPPLLAALIGWPLFYRRNRHVAIGVILVVSGYLLVVGRWQNLGGWCWGPRHLFQLTPFLLLPLPYLFASDSSTETRKFGLPLFRVTLILGIFVQIMGVLVDYMWPLDKSLRGLPARESTEKVLSLDFYGPLLHLKTWRLEREPDWIWFDLWRSGQWEAASLSLAVWGFLGILSILLAWLSIAGWNRRSPVAMDEPASPDE